MASHNSLFDGFVSFRGVDMRDTLSKKVKEALGEKGFTVFYDEEHIGEGDIIKKKIKEGINNSQIHIVLLSENFAESGS